MTRKEQTFALSEIPLPEELFFELGFSSLFDEAGPWTESNMPKLREAASRLESQGASAKRVVVIRARDRVYLSELAMRVARREGMWQKSSRACSLGEIPLRAELVIGEAVDAQALRARG
jgi:hypothetical protein